MNLIDMIMIGIGLSMDAATVAVTNGMVYRPKRDKKILMPVFFGIFQGIMPVFGYYTGGVFARWLTRYSGVIIFLIFAFLGIQMLREGFSHEIHQKKEPGRFNYRVLLMQSLATSIDAFAVGIALRAANISVWLPAGIICVTTLVISAGAVLLGNRFGEHLGKKAEVFGGSILLLLALKALLF